MDTNGWLWQNAAVLVLFEFKIWQALGYYL